MTIEFLQNEGVRSGSVLDPNCPSRQLLQHITSRWGVLVMLVLCDGSKRFGELKRAINGIFCDIGGGDYFQTPDRTWRSWF